MNIKNSIKFILNDSDISADVPAGMVTLDYIRRHHQLTGTKEGCREGDCGACAVLLGEVAEDGMRYKTVNSCLLPFGELDGKHLVTIEGLNQKDISPLQRAMIDEGAIQCGFCTPGLVISLTGFLLNCRELNLDHAVAALDGNLCRCTGYQSIKRAANALLTLLADSGFAITSDANRVDWLVQHEFIPKYFTTIPHRLSAIDRGQVPVTTKHRTEILVAGGTDLFVQKPDDLANADIEFLSNQKNLGGVWQDNGCVYIGATTTIQELGESTLLRTIFPNLQDYLKLVASTPIRNRATVGGNIVNASPIGDLTIIFLAMDATINLSSRCGNRVLALKHLFKDYKSLARADDEILQWVSFTAPASNSKFNFEKVCTRTHLDIASVNSACQISIVNDSIESVHISAGGVAPIPLYLTKTANCLTGGKLSADTILKAIAVAQSEIKPISDMRGSADYKRLLLHQLLVAHFITLFPKLDLREVRQ